MDLVFDACFNLVGDILGFCLVIFGSGLDILVVGLIFTFFILALSYPI